MLKSSANLKSEIAFGGRAVKFSNRGKDPSRMPYLQKEKKESTNAVGLERRACTAQGQDQGQGHNYNTTSTFDSTSGPSTLISGSQRPKIKLRHPKRPGPLANKSFLSTPYNDSKTFLRLKYTFYFMSRLRPKFQTQG